MKTRIIQTKFYKDNDVVSLGLYAQHLFIYLLTCEHINMSGYFELPDQFIMLEAKLTPKQLEEAKEELERHKKVFFYEGWIYVVNAEKNNKYRNSPKNEVAFDREIDTVPDYIKAYFDSSIDSSINGSIDSTHKSKIINHKSEKIEKIPKKKIEEAWENFWREYPNKKSKPKAKVLFFRLFEACKDKEEGNQLFKDMITAIHIQKETKQWIEGFIPHPTTWLNERRWGDEYSNREF